MHNGNDTGRIMDPIALAMMASGIAVKSAITWMAEQDRTAAAERAAEEMARQGRITNRWVAGGVVALALGSAAVALSARGQESGSGAAPQTPQISRERAFEVLGLSPAVTTAQLILHAHGEVIADQHLDDPESLTDEALRLKRAEVDAARDLLLEDAE